MAEGEAGELAERAGLGWLRPPPLWWATDQSVAVALFARRRRRERQIGELSVPVWLAVIASDLAGLGGVPADAGSAGVAVLAWAVTAMLLGRLTGSAIAGQPGMGVAEGTWFLGPEALLADAIVAAALAPHVSAATRSLVGWRPLQAAVSRASRAPSRPCSRPWAFEEPALPATGGQLGESRPDVGASAQQPLVGSRVSSRPSASR